MATLISGRCYMCVQMGTAGWAVPELQGAPKPGLVVGVTGQGWSCPVEGPWRWVKGYDQRTPWALGQELVPAFAPLTVSLIMTPCSRLPSYPASLPDWGWGVGTELCRPQAQMWDRKLSQSLLHVSLQT